MNSAKSLSLLGGLFVCAAMSPVVTAEERQPRFIEGTTKWFVEKVLLEEQKEDRDFCERLYPGTRPEITPTGDLRMMCYSRQSRELTSDELAKARSAFEQRERTLPSKRLPPVEVWNSLVAANKCPNGMKSALSVKPKSLCYDDSSLSNVPTKWERCKAEVVLECMVVLSEKDFCPHGKVALGQRSCIVGSCPDGYKLLRQETKLDIPGCYRCPSSGVLDLRETALAAGTDPDRVLKHGQSDGFTAVLCREGPSVKRR